MTKGAYNQEMARLHLREAEDDLSTKLNLAKIRERIAMLEAELEKETAHLEARQAGSLVKRQRLEHEFMKERADQWQEDEE